MAEEKNISKSDVPATLSTETLLKMLIEERRENASANKLLADAILESRKPYVDPKVLEAKQLAGEQRRQEIETTLKIKVETKRRCPHLREADNTSNIKWMEHSNGIVKGVCGQCFSEFDTRNANDLRLLRADMKAVRNMGRAGQHSYTKGR